MVIGGFVAGAGALTLASTTGGSCEHDDPGGNVGCGMEAVGGAIVGGSLLLLGTVILLGSAASSEPATASPQPLPPPKTVSMRMR
jgi:hypothetical protein